MKILKNILHNLSVLTGKNKYFGVFKPILNALDEAAFGTDKVVAGPHIADYTDIKRFMTMVIVALVPATAASIFFFGFKIIPIIITSYVFGGLVEVAFAVVRKKEIHEGFLVTGLIFPLLLPPTVPLWVVAVGSAFGVLFGKEVFGGTGKNIFNPAIVGRIFLSVAFPSIMTVSWQVPFSVDAVAQATPLALFKNQGVLIPYMDLFLGNTTGCIGETFKLGLIAGGLFLIFIKIVDWRIPLAYLGTVVISTVIGHHFLPAKFASPLFYLLSGGLLLGAFFMATDPVTSPFTKPGKWIAGILLGALTMLIRVFSGYVEGVMFSILIVNVFTPLIDSMVLGVKYPSSKK